MTTSTLRERLSSVPSPDPILSRERESRLTPRQRDLLARLELLFDDGFTDFTMADFAARLRCSLRTLYDLAPGRNELVLIVVDCKLWRVGREAATVFNAGLSPLNTLRRYLSIAAEAVAGTTQAFARDIATLPAATTLTEAHLNYLSAVAKCLLDAAVEQGEIAAVDTAAFAFIMARIGGELARPDVLPTLGSSSPKSAADEIIGAITRGLAASRPSGLLASGCP